MRTVKEIFAELNEVATWKQGPRQCHRTARTAALGLELGAALKCEREAREAASDQRLRDIAAAITFDTTAGSA